MKLYVNEIIRTNNFEDDDMMNKILGMWDSFYKIMMIIKGKYMQFIMIMNRIIKAIIH
ncbi:hypothetical protein IS250_2457 [Staphylococcus epidermidis IS-250]|nr:hypothetical protein IS250_2457 [Staphylococcus epidermidis IS-250]